MLGCGSHRYFIYELTGHPINNVFLNFVFYYDEKRQYVPQGQEYANYHHVFSALVGLKLIMYQGKKSISQGDLKPH